MNVPGQHQKIRLDPSEQTSGNRNEVRKAIKMRIAEVQNAIAMEGRVKIRKRDRVVHQLDVECISPPAVLQSSQPEAALKNRQRRAEDPVWPQRAWTVGTKCEPLRLHTATTIGPSSAWRQLSAGARRRCVSENGRAVAGLRGSRQESGWSAIRGGAHALPMKGKRVCVRCLNSCGASALQDGDHRTRLIQTRRAIAPIRRLVSAL
jgi:hypothetical protein